MSNDEKGDDSGGRKGGSNDVALIHGVSPEGDLRVLRKRQDRLELGVIKSLREGMPIVGEVVRLKPRKEFPLVCDVETELVVPGAAGGEGAGATRSGPAQVATDDYRTNWDRIWNRPSKGGVTN